MVPNIVTYKTNEEIKKHREDRKKNSQDVLFLVIQSSFSIKNKIM